MNFKKPKHQVIQDASWNAYNAIQYNLMQMYSGPITNIGPMVSEAIRIGIEQALTSMINDIYTDAEFEEDINLRDKV